jgi:hypothetical protein
MKRLISKMMVVIMTLTFVSCGGYLKDVEYPHVPRFDEAERKSCSDIRYEIRQKSFEVKKSKDQIKLRNVCNVVFGVTGVLLFFPFLFLIDPTKKDNTNYENRVYEYNYLIDLAEEKECETGGYYKTYPEVGKGK